MKGCFDAQKYHVEFPAQDAMRAAEKKSTEDCPVKMKLVAPPLYVLTTNVRPVHESGSNCTY